MRDSSGGTAAGAPAATAAREVPGPPRRGDADAGRPPQQKLKLQDIKRRRSGEELQDIKGRRGGGDIQAEASSDARHAEQVAADAEAKREEAAREGAARAEKVAADLAAEAETARDRSLAAERRALKAEKRAKEATRAAEVHSIPGSEAGAARLRGCLAWIRGRCSAAPLPLSLCRCRCMPADTVLACCRCSSGACLLMLAADDPLAGARDSR